MSWLAFTVPEYAMLAWTWCFWGSGPFCLGWWLERLALPGLIAFLVYWLAVRQLGKKRAIDFADKQLAEFYGPMVAARAEIFNHTKFDRYVRAASQHVHAKKLKREEHRKVDMEYVRQGQVDVAELERFFDTLNDRMYNVTIEAYINMRKLFAVKMAYADADTQAWYDYFYAFVEMWQVLREHDKNSFLPKGVGGTIGAMFTEELLQPFYGHLKERAAHLQDEIAGKAEKKSPAPKPPSTETLDLLKKLDDD